MKRCSTLYVTRKVQIKTATSYHYTPIRMARIRTLITPNAGEDVEQWELSFTAGGKAKLYRHFGRQFDSVSEN